jgi:hypothetical protein
VDSLGVLRLLAYHEHGISKLAIRDSRDARRVILWVDLEEDRLDFRFGAGSWGGRRGLALFVQDPVKTSLEPFTAVGKPPTEGKNRDSSRNGPPERQHEVRGQANSRKGHPEDFALHGPSLTQNAQYRRECLANPEQLG